MKKNALLAFIIVLCFAFPAYAWEIAAGPTYQDCDISGKVKSNGTEIDVESDLGLTSDDPIGVNVRLNQGRHHLSFDFSSFDFSAAKTLTGTIQFEGKTYTVSTSVTSKVQYDLYEAQYLFDFIHIDNDLLTLTVAPLLKISVYDAELNLKGGGNDETYSETLPIPSAGLAAEVGIFDYISLLAQCSGVAYSGDEYIEYKGVVRLKPIKFVHLDLGYKGTKLDYADKDDLLDIDVGGLFFEAALAFEF